MLWAGFKSKEMRKAIPEHGKGKSKGTNIRTSKSLGLRKSTGFLRRETLQNKVGKSDKIRLCKTTKSKLAVLGQPPVTTGEALTLWAED